jgi:hypothetical protein
MTHQMALSIVRRHGSQVIQVSCACLAVPRAGRPRHTVIASRYLFPAADAIAAWRAWHAERGVIV